MHTTLEWAPGLLFLSEHTSQLQYQLLKFQVLYVQPVTQCYKWRTLGEAPLQSIQSQQKTRTIPVKHREAITCHYYESTPFAVSKDN